MSSVFRKKKKEPLFDSGPQAFNLLMKEAVVREFLELPEAGLVFPLQIPLSGVCFEYYHSERMFELPLNRFLSIWGSGSFALFPLQFLEAVCLDKFCSGLFSLYLQLSPPFALPLDE